MLRLHYEQIVSGRLSDQETRQVMSVLSFNEFDRHFHLCQFVPTKLGGLSKKRSSVEIPGLSGRPGNSQPRCGSGFINRGREIRALEMNQITTRLIWPLHRDCKGVMHPTANLLP